ncbi:hypothetical protein [Acinetobacter baumannii]|uniref:hypothetical protein n=1 Tax=Acinetobacter baumannii TaxID=470 RepID=UPI0022B5A9E1|nr:hypothetical protein [Acinetobacter baumannii]MDC5426655.1 hypothetical protein [Acinetobacter baumannii]
MKYFKKDKQVFGFDDDQLDLITEDYIEMTVDEIDRHLNPQNYLTDEEKEYIRLSVFKPLTRRQFKLTLLDNNLLETVEQRINAIQDPIMRTRIQIEYNESVNFERSSESVALMSSLLELTSEQVDALWEHALTL